MLPAWPRGQAQPVPPPLARRMAGPDGRRGKEGSDRKEGERKEGGKESATARITPGLRPRKTHPCGRPRNPGDCAAYGGRDDSRGRPCRGLTRQPLFTPRLRYGRIGDPAPPHRQPHLPGRHADCPAPKRRCPRCLAGYLAGCAGYRPSGGAGGNGLWMAGPLSAVAWSALAVARLTCAGASAGSRSFAMRSAMRRARRA